MMTLKESAQHIGAQIGYAFTITMALLIGIEWLMPGSVLPFVNVVSFLPISFLVIIFLLSLQNRRKCFLNTISIVFGIIITIALFASLLTSMPIYGLRTILLSSAILIIIAVWAVIMYTEH